MSFNVAQVTCDSTKGENDMKMKRTISLLLVLAALMAMLPMTVSAAGSGGNAAPQLVTEGSVPMNGASTLTLVNGEKQRVYPTINGWRVKGTNWRTTNMNVATVSSGGLIYTKGPGTCYISCKAYGRTIRLKLTVLPRAKVVAGTYDGPYIGIKFHNNDRTKTITQIRFKVTEINSYGRALCTWKGTAKNLWVGRGRDSGYMWFSLDYPSSCERVSVSIDRVWYANGTTFKP